MKEVEGAAITYEFLLSHLISLMGSAVTISIGAAWEHPLVQVTITGRLTEAEISEPADPHESLDLLICGDTDDQMCAIYLPRSSFKVATLESGVPSFRFGELTYWIGPG